MATMWRQPAGLLLNKNIQLVHSVKIHKWRQTAGLLLNKNVPLVHGTKIYDICVRPAITDAPETWELILMHNIAHQTKRKTNHTQLHIQEHKSVRSNRKAS